MKAFVSSVLLVTLMTGSTWLSAKETDEPQAYSLQQQALEELLQEFENIDNSEGLRDQFKPVFIDIVSDSEMEPEDQQRLMEQVKQMGFKNLLKVEPLLPKAEISPLAISQQASYSLLGIAPTSLLPLNNNFHVSEKIASKGGVSSGSHASKLVDRLMPGVSSENIPGVVRFLANAGLSIAAIKFPAFKVATKSIPKKL